MLTRADDALVRVEASLLKITQNLTRQADPAAVAAAVISQLAAGGFSTDEIAAHILAGLPAELAGEVVAAMGAKLDAPPPAPGA